MTPANFEVWHQDDMFSGKDDDAIAAEFPAGFHHVAEVRTDRVEACYGLTQHVAGPWWENDDADRVTNVGERSTSVGDVIVASVAHGFDEVNQRPIWRRWIVARVGFVEF